MARTVTDKTSHIGRAGQFAAMAEILARGWNVAIPEVDVGDDVFVAQDDGARLTRVQLKTTAADESGTGTWVSGTIKLPYDQLMREDEAVPLTYAFAIRCGGRWEFVVVDRDTLRAAWRSFDTHRTDAEARGERKPGRPRKNPEGSPKEVGIQLTLREGTATAWGGESFQRYRNNWEAFELLMLPAEEPSTAPDPSSSPAPPAPTGIANDRD